MGVSIIWSLPCLIHVGAVYLANCPTTFRAHEDSIVAVAFSPDGTILATTGLDCTIRLWDRKSQPPRQVGVLNGHTSVVLDLAFSPNGRRLASVGGAEATIRIWDLQRQPPQAVLCPDQPSSTVYSATFSSDSQYIALARGRDVSAQVWDIASVPAKLVATLVGHDDYVWSVAFSPDAKRVLSMSGDGTVQVWEVGSPAVRIAKRQLQDITSLDKAVFSSDGKSLLTTRFLSRQSFSINRWLIGSEKESQLMQARHPAVVHAILLRPDLNAVVSADKEGRIFYRDINADHNRREWVFPAKVKSLALSTDGQYLAVGHMDGTVSIVSVPILRNERSDRGMTRKRLSKDEQDHP